MGQLRGDRPAPSSAEFTEPSARYSRDRAYAGYQGEPDPGAGYPTSGPQAGYRPRHESDGYPSPDYDDPGYDDPGSAGRADPYEEAGYSPGGYRAASGQPGGGYPGESGYPGGDRYPGDGGYAGEDGYAHDEHYAGDADYTDDDQYPDGAGYSHGFAGEDDVYPGWAARPGSQPEQPGGDGYGDAGEWYRDADDEQEWADEEYGEGFPPGIGDRAGIRRGPDSGARHDRAPRAGASGRRGGKSKRGFRRAAPWVALNVLVVLLVMGGGAYYYVWRTYFHPPDYSGAGSGTVEIQIKPGETATAVGQTLLANGVIASVRAFANAAKSSGQGSALEPGHYLLHRHMSAILAFKMLLSPSSRVQTKVVIPEGLRLSNIIATLGKATGNQAGYKQAVKQTSQLGLPSFAHGDPQGYLFPATYSIQPGTPPLKVLQQMVTAFDQEAARVHLTRVAAADFLTPRDVITVASLIEAEGGRISDYPKIAGVIYNRLNRGMPLQLDSTVLFALGKYGILATAAELKVNSPYNTYRHKGLPPGPIDSPGDAAIRAALHPRHSNWMYFVTVNPKTGLTKFTSSFAQAQQYQAELRDYLAKHG